MENSLPYAIFCGLFAAIANQARLLIFMFLVWTYFAKCSYFPSRFPGKIPKIRLSELCDEESSNNGIGVLGLISKSHSMILVYILPDKTNVIVFVLSVCFSVVNLNLRYNLWTVGDRDFILGMHTPLMTLSNDNKSNDLVILTLTFELIYLSGLCCRRGHSFSQTHLDNEKFKSSYINSMLNVWSRNLFIYKIRISCKR